MNHCLKKNPNERLQADILLGSPWLSQNGATTLESSVETMRVWLAEEDAAAAGGDGAGGEGGGGGLGEREREWG